MDNLEIWEKIFQENEWGKYSSVPVIRFIARNFYKVKDRKNIKILEIGSGTGANLWFCAREGFSVIALEGSQTAFEFFKAHNMLTHYPTAGDIVLYDWQGDGRYDHTGLYLKHNDNGTFSTIEGNTSTANQSNGGIVMIRTRKYKNCTFAHIS